MPLKITINPDLPKPKPWTKEQMIEYGDVLKELSSPCKYCKERITIGFMGLHLKGCLYLEHYGS